MHWHILGVGAIGSVWAAQLHLAGYQVTLLLRNKQKLLTYQQQGLVYESDKLGRHQLNIDAELIETHSPIENLLIVTKAFASLEALNSVAERLTPHSRVVMLQNGMGPQQQAAAQYPHLPIWAATTTDGAYLKKPFHVIRAGYGETLYGPINQSATEFTGSLFPTACPELQINQTPDILHKLWCKVAINAAINPLTALYQCKNGELLNTAERRNTVADLCDEISRVANACDQPLFEQPLFDVVAHVAKQTAGNFSSMHQDILHQRPTEIEQITGFICDEATRHGIATPINEALRHEIQALSERSK